MSSILPYILLFALICLSSFSFSCKKRVSSAPEEHSIPLVKAKQLTNQLIVRAAVNNQEGLFIVDTGATTCALSRQFAKKLDLRLKDQPSNSTVSNIESEIKSATINSLKIGNVVANNFKVVVVDLHHINKLTDEPIDGIIGIPLLSKLSALTIDYQNQLLILNTQQYLGDYTPFTLEQYQLFTNIVINEIPIKMKIDTGASGTIVEAATWELIKGSGTISEKVMAITNINKTTKKNHQLVSIDTLTLGDISVNDLTIRSDKLNLLGNNLLKRYLVTFVFNENKMYLQSTGNKHK